MKWNSSNNDMLVEKNNKCNIDILEWQLFWDRKKW